MWGTHNFRPIYANLESQIPGLCVNHPPSSHLNSVVGFLVDDGYVLPAELEDNLGHGEGLVVVDGDGAREVLEALLVGQLGTRGEEGDLEARSGGNRRDKNIVSESRAEQAQTKNLI